MKRIQFILHYSDLYGANRVILPLLCHLRDKGYKVFVLLPTKGDMFDELIKNDIECKVIYFYAQILLFKKSIKFMAYPLLLLINIFQVPYIYKYIKTNKPDIIYSNTAAENIGSIMSKLIKIPHILHIHELVSLDHGIAFIGGNFIRKKYIQLSDKVIYVSKVVAKNFIGTNILPKNHRVIYNGLAEVCELKNKNLDVKNLSLGIVGILSSGKRQHIAIEYFKEIVKQYPKAKLHIYGDTNGKYKKRLHQLVDNLDLKDNVIFHGFIKDQNKIYNAIDILLTFSISEGFGLVTVEAMMRGIPIIGYDNSATSEIIEHKRSGYLFHNKKDFELGVEYILDSQHYTEIRLEAYDRANKLFNDKIYCTNIEKFINE